MILVMRDQQFCCTLPECERQSAMESVHLMAELCIQASYSTLMHGLSQQNINLNRKVLSELAINEPLSFKALVDQVKFMRART